MKSAFLRRLSSLEFRRYAHKTNLKPQQVEKNLKSVETSLASKGFLRSIKPYAPPENVVDKINQITSETKIKSITNLDNKYQLLNACFEEFGHSVPNSYLHEINTLDDVIKFYETPVDTTTPYDALKQMKLPENLHIQSDYVRFSPDADNIFKGQTAFPKSSTLVTGLKYRKKYDGYTAKRSWP